MNILDEKFAEFLKLPTEERIECFEKDGRLYDMIISQQSVESRNYRRCLQNHKSAQTDIKEQGRFPLHAKYPLPQTGHALVYPAFLQDFPVF